MTGRAEQADPPVWIRGRLQPWLDRRIAGSTAAREALAELDGRSFAVVLEGPAIRLQFEAAGERLVCIAAGERPADATLIASPLDALALARSRGLAELKKTDARLEGNIHVAESFARVFGFLNPDIEAELADWIGHTAAHEVAGAGRLVADFCTRVFRTLEQDAAEFALYEQPVLARSEEVDGYIEAVDDLRYAADRLASRLDSVERRRSAGRD